MCCKCGCGASRVGQLLCLNPHSALAPAFNCTAGAINAVVSTDETANGGAAPGTARMTRLALHIGKVGCGRGDFHIKLFAMHCPCLCTAIPTD